MLIQIHEPGQTPLPHDQDTNIAVGIDLGTTNSLVAFAKDDSASEVICDKDGHYLHPSIVAYKESGEVLTGNNAAKETNYISSIKRLMGKGAKDTDKYWTSHKILQDQGIIKLDINGKILTPIEISAQILKSLKQQATQALGKEINQAVITVPAYFDDNARQATKDAAKLAGLEVLRLVNEPTAAALAYGLDKGTEGIYAIYDLGGGTFDISILKMEKGIFQVLATGGSVEIGGDDFDREIAQIFLWQCRNNTTKPINYSNDEWHNVLKLARIAKESLTKNDQYETQIELGGDKYQVRVTKQELENAMDPYLSATKDISMQAIDDAKINIEDIKGIVLVGGSTRSPIVQKYIEEIINKKPLCDIDPDQVVVQGASMQARALTHGSDNLLLDVTPLSLGLEIMGGLVEKIIPRNTPIPVAKTQEFTTYEDGQTGIILHIVQGEREMAEQNRSLARFEINNIPPLKASIAKIKVTFSVDVDGLLTVCAVEETTNTKQEIEVKPSYGLSEEEIKQMLYSSMEHGKEDMKERLLAESIIDAKRLIIALEPGLKDDRDLLSDKEYNAIMKAKTDLKDAIEKDNRDDIIEKAKILEEVTHNFAENRINKHIASSLRGTKIS